MNRLHVCGALALSGAFWGLVQGQEKAIPAAKIALPAAGAQLELGGRTAPTTQAGKDLAVLRSQFTVQQSTVLAKLRTTDNEADRIEIVKQLPKGEPVAQKALEIAKKDLEDEAAFDALQFASTLGTLPTSKAGSEAREILFGKFISHPKMKMMIASLASTPDGRQQAKNLLSNDKLPRDTKGQLLFSLAQSAQTNLQRGLRAEEQAKALEEVAKQYELIAKEYADVAGPRGGTLGDMAKPALFEIRNLSAGKFAPEVTCLKLDGDKELEDKLSNYKGKVVVLDIWATWCGPCKQMIPHEREMVERLKDKPFALISVSGDDKMETLRNFLEKEKMPWTHWFAERKGILKDWNIRYYPTIYILDHTGKIRHKDLRGEKMEEAVNELLSEMKETK